MNIYYRFILHVLASFGHHPARAYPDTNITRKKDNCKRNCFMFEIILPSSNFYVYIYIYICTHMMDKRSPNTYTFIINNDTYTSFVTDVIFIYIL